jgi:hypothetical protein
MDSWDIGMLNFLAFFLSLTVIPMFESTGLRPFVGKEGFTTTAEKLDHVAQYWT